MTDMDRQSDQEKGFKNSWVFYGLCAAFFCLVFFAVRIPFYQTPLSYEEGKYAWLAFEQPQGPDYSLMGRINGQEILHRMNHPALMYELIRAAAFSLDPVLFPCTIRQPNAVDWQIRLFYSFFQLMFFLTLLFALQQVKHYKGEQLTAWLLFAAVCLSPLAVKSSTQAWVDNSAGVLLVLPAGLCMAFGLRERNLKSGKTIFFIIATVFAAGLGKQEWSAALLGGLLLWSVYLLVVGRLGRWELLLAGLAVLSLAAGNAVSFLFDPANYTDGLGVILKFAPHTRTEDSQPYLVSLFSMNIRRLPYTFILFFLTAVFLLYLFLNPRNMSCGILLCFCFGLCLFGGFFLTPHHPSGRYFAPAMTILTTAILRAARIYTLPGIMKKTIQTASVLCILAGLLFIGIKWIHMQNHTFEPQNPDFTAKKTIYMVTSAEGWDQELNYLDATMSMKKAIRLAKENGILRIQKGFTGEILWEADKQQAYQRKTQTVSRYSSRASERNSGSPGTAYCKPRVLLR